MKTAIAVAVQSIVWLFVASPLFGAEPAPFDWIKLQADPEPATDSTLREKFQAHLVRVDRSLAVLRSVKHQPNHSWPAHRLSSRQCVERLDEAFAFVTTPSHSPAIQGDLGSVNELVDNLTRAKEIARQANQGQELTAEMSRVLQGAHGFIKMVRRHIKTLSEKGAQEYVHLDTSGADPKRTCGRPALIVRPAVNSPPAQSHLTYPIGAALWQLAVLTADQRAAFMKQTVEDDETRVLEMFAEPDADKAATSFFVLLEKNVELPDGSMRTVHLPFRSTFEQTGTEGLWNVLKILSNTSQEANVTVRNSLLAEIPITPELSITSCETYVTFAPALDEEHRGQTVISFGADIELTFYQRVSSRIRDVSFRSVAVSKSNASLERAKLRGATRACDELTRMLSQASVIQVKD